MYVCVRVYVCVCVCTCVCHLSVLCTYLLLYTIHTLRIQCRQLSVKVCRCRKKKKSVLCSSEYLCDVRCTKLRQCGSHQCKRKVGGAREPLKEGLTFVQNVADGVPLVHCQSKCCVVCLLFFLLSVFLSSLV